MTKPKTRPAAAPDAKTYDVVWGIKHNGTRYATGEQAELTDEQAAPFVASGSIVAAAPKADPEAEARAAAEAAAAEERAKAEAEQAAQAAIEAEAERAASEAQAAAADTTATE